MARDLKAKQPDPGEAEILKTPAEQDDATLFHTTSTPDKPASSVLGSPPDSKPSAASVASRPRVQAPSQSPARPAGQPDLPAGAHAEAHRKPPTPASPSEEFTLKERRRKTLRTKLDVVRAVVRDASVCEVAQRSPREVSLVGKSEGVTHVTFWFRDGTHQPVTCPVRVTPDPDVQQVVFRVTIAELKRSSAGGLDGRAPPASSQDGSLLRALSDVRSGATPIVLTDLDLNDVEGSLDSLQQQDLLRILGRPTLVATSGRAATIVAGQRGPGRAAENEKTGPADAGDVRTTLTLLAVVTDKGTIDLQLVSKFHRPAPGAGTDEHPAVQTQETAARVHLHRGQTLVIGGPLAHVEEEDDKGFLPAVTQILDFRSPKRRESKLVLLVTPELIRRAPSKKDASLATFNASRPR